MNHSKDSVEWIEMAGCEGEAEGICAGLTSGCG